MAFQNTAMSVANTQLIGGFQLFYATTAGGSWTNLGLGRGFTFTEEITKYNSQANNGPDPLEGVAKQEAVATFELIEWYPPSWDAMRGGLLDIENASSVSTYISGTPTANVFSTGGLQELAAKAYKFVNTKKVSASTVQTIIVLYKAYIDSGLAFTSVSDNAEDPITIISHTIRAKCDTGRAAGDQLLHFETQMGA